MLSVKSEVNISTESSSNAQSISLAEKINKLSNRAGSVMNHSKYICDNNGTAINNK